MKIPIAQEGMIIIKLIVLMAIGFYILGGISHAFRYVSVIFIVAGLFSVYFFRDPERKINYNENMVLSPADGRIFDIQENGSMVTIKIFMSVTNVHVQRAPSSGEIVSVQYKPGKFLHAMDKDADAQNEQNLITMREAKFNTVMEIKQIAGIIARRIACRVREKDRVTQGQRLGMIRFGSQVDISLPKSMLICVNRGERVKAGVTILGKFSGV